jgi:hypothetical protein
MFSPGSDPALGGPVGNLLDITHLDSQTISQGCNERYCNSDEFPHNLFFNTFRKANVVSLDDV